MRKCDGCIFKRTDQDMGATIECCTYFDEDDLAEGIKRCKNPLPCKYYTSRRMVKEYQRILEYVMESIKGDENK